MHQYTRNSPRPTSAAIPAQPNPSRSGIQRTQSDRDTLEPLSHFDRTTSEAAASTALPSAERQAKEAEKIRQVSQNFFRKAAQVIVASRVNLTPEIIAETGQVRSTKWFQLILDESQEVSEDVADWTIVDVVNERPAPMIIEIFLDTSELKKNQTLVVLDERENPWDVCEALSGPLAPGQPSNRRQRSPIVILERWKIYMAEPPAVQSNAANEPMANVYKKASVLFRSLHTYARFLPAWKFSRKLASQPATLTTIRPMFRILDHEPAQSQSPRDPLNTPLYPTASKPTQEYHFNPISSPSGSYNIQLSYRTNCNFHVDDSDTLLSSHFMGMDDQHFDSSLGNAFERRIPYAGAGNEVGSLPVDRRWPIDRSDLTHAYGSLSTFHHQGHGTGTSPISALRAAREIASHSPSGSPPQKPQPIPRVSGSSITGSTRAEPPTPAQRRVSVSFQPFKHGSLSSSPAAGIMTPPSPSSAASVKPLEMTRDLPTRTRTSVSTLPQTVLRASPVSQTPEVAVGSPSSGSPKAPPISRYSSSFGHRRSRFSSGGTSASKTEDDNNSSGKASQSSSTQPGSGVLGEGESGSPGSMQTDDENISDFLKLLEQKKDLKSFNRSDDASRDASTRRTSAALSKFRGMRDSNAALGDSLSSSTMLHRSSSSSSRQLPMLAGASVSTSSSPGKAISPHTPYTPTVPSRLSEHSTIRREESLLSVQNQSEHQQTLSDDSSSSTTRGFGSGAIPIPTSPQRYPYLRRSSSAHPRHRAALEGLEGYDRPASLSGLDDRPETSLSELLHTQQTAEQMRLGDETLPQDETSNIPPHGSSLESHEGEQASSSADPAGSSIPRSSTFRTPNTRRGGSNRGAMKTGRHSFSNRSGGTAADDDEPLLFYMSELGRRSLEDVESTASNLETTRASSSSAASASNPPNPSSFSTSRGETQSKRPSGGRSRW